MSVSPSSSEPGPRFRVAICGAGIAGLVLAITIGKYNPSIPIDLYEAHDSIESAGVGIALTRHEILVDLGLYEEFKRISTHDPNKTQVTHLRRSDIPEGGYTWYERTHHRNTLTMHRQQMIAVLEKNLPSSCTVHSKKRLVNYAEPECLMSPIVLEFEDGTTATTDVLIGADGIRSTVRKTMFEAASTDQDVGDETDFEQYKDALFTGITMYRCLMSAESLRKDSPKNLALKDMTFYQGKGRSFVTYPIAGGTVINFAASLYDPNLTGTCYEGRWVSEATHDKLAEFFTDYEPDGQAILKLCEKPSKWAMHIVKPLPFWVRKRVALIGDACHAMPPYCGAGASQGMDDAFVIGRLIAHPLTSLSRIPDILRIYEQIRLPIAREVAHLSFSTGQMFTFSEPGYYDGTRTKDDLDERGIGAFEREGTHINRKEIERRWEWLDGLGSVMLAWEEAESKLEALVEGTDLCAPIHYSFMHRTQSVY